MGYDAEATRERIFAAATAEFSQYGLAGGRIDRIAAGARANKQAIYLYFGSKEKLFGAVVRAKMDEIGGTIDLDPAEVPEAVGRLFDWYQEHPELIRLLLWEALETRDLSVEHERREVFRQKTEHFSDAVGSAPEVQDLMFTIFGLIAWNFAVPHVRQAVLDEQDETVALARRRATVVATARLLVETAALR